MSVYVCDFQSTLSNLHIYWLTEHRAAPYTPPPSLCFCRWTAHLVFMKHGSKLSVSLLWTTFILAALSLTVTFLPGGQSGSLWTLTMSEIKTKYITSLFQLDTVGLGKPHLMEVRSSTNNLITSTHPNRCSTLLSVYVENTCIERSLHKQYFSWIKWLLMCLKADCFCVTVHTLTSFFFSLLTVFHSFSHCFPAKLDAVLCEKAPTQKAFLYLPFILYHPVTTRQSWESNPFKFPV